MRCDLKAMMRSTPECDRESCVYWNDTCADPAFPLSNCTLIRFGLIGKHPDKLARWLYHYMLLHTRNKALAMVAKGRRSRVTPLARARTVQAVRPSRED